MNLSVCLIAFTGVLLGLASCPAISSVHSPYFKNTNNQSYENQLLGINLSNPYKLIAGSATLEAAQYEVDDKQRKDRNRAQRQRINERRQHFESLTPQEKRRVKEARKKFQQLPQEEREKLKQKWRDLSPEERQKAMKKKRAKLT